MYLLKRTWKWTTVSCKCVSMARFTVSIWCAIYTAKTDFGVHMRHNDWVKGRIISTPNRNSCYWNTLSWGCPCSASLHSHVWAHFNDQSVRDYHIEIDKRATMINFPEEAALSTLSIVLGGLGRRIGGWSPSKKALEPPLDNCQSLACMLLVADAYKPPFSLQSRIIMTDCRKTKLDARTAVTSSPHG